MNQLENFVWINGSLVPASSAYVSVFDHGFVVGDGVFETIDINQGKPFAITRHLDRLARSAAALCLKCPPKDLLLEACYKVINANKCDRAALRITLSGGISPIGSLRGDADPTLVIATREVIQRGESENVIVVDWPRNERGALSGVKSTSYGENVRALEQAKQQGATEAIFPNTIGNICEGTGSNIFIVKDGSLFTPTLQSGCLEGVTRALVIESSKVIEKDFPIEFLEEVDEAFLASTTRPLSPIAKINNRTLLGTKGPITKSVINSFNELVFSNEDP